MWGLQKCEWTRTLNPQALSTTHTTVDLGTCVVNVSLVVQPRLKPTQISLAAIVLVTTGMFVGEVVRTMLRLWKLIHQLADAAFSAAWEHTSAVGQTNISPARDHLLRVGATRKTCVFIVL